MHVYCLLSILHSAFACLTLLTMQYSRSASLCKYERYKEPLSSQTEVCFSPATCSKLTSSTLFRLISAQEGINISEPGGLEA